MRGKVSNTPTKLEQHEANKHMGCGKVDGVRIHGMAHKRQSPACKLLCSENDQAIEKEKKGHGQFHFATDSPSY